MTRENVMRIILALLMVVASLTAWLMWEAL